MGVAALYDIHGNLPALERVLEEVASEQVSQLVVGGDVLPGPMARECLDLLLAYDLPTRFVRGNGDREVLERIRGEESDAVPEAFREPLRWHARELGPEHERALSAWPLTLHAETDLGSVLFCHATPKDDNAIFTKVTDERRLAGQFEGVRADLVVCGHTHMQFDRTVAGTRVVNAGSVGMPLGEPGAYWLLIGREVQFRRTEYDLDAAAERILATQYPNADGFVNQFLLHRPSEEQMVARYEEFIAR